MPDKGVKPPTRWFGGKSRWRSQILPLLPKHKKYVEPFAGMAAVFFGKEPAPIEILNDLNGGLITFYRCLQHHPDALVEAVAKLPVARNEYHRLASLDPAYLTDIQRAARFFYMQHLKFMGRPTATAGGISLNCAQPAILTRGRYAATLYACHARLHQAVIEQLPANECIRRYDSPATAFYVDPPYIAAENTYGIPFTHDDQAALADTLLAIKGTFILSLDDDPLARNLYRGCRFRTLKVIYGSLGRGAAKRVTELLIIGPPKPKATPKGRKLKRPSKAS